MGADGQQCDEQGKSRGRWEQPRRQIDVISETLQPQCMAYASHGPGDEIGPQHGLGELPKQKLNYIAGISAQGLADTDFVRPLLGYGCSQGQHAKGGEQDGYRQQRPRTTAIRAALRDTCSGYVP